MKKRANDWWAAMAAFTLISGAVVATRYLGGLQFFEWGAYDLFFRSRSKEAPDERIVIVGITEDDLQKYKQPQLSDRTLAELLSRIKTQKPRVIGLDLIRDLPVADFALDKKKNQESYNKLTDIFQSTPNLIGIEKTSGGEFDPEIAAPLALKNQRRTSASDAIVDGDLVMRRGYMYVWVEGNGQKFPLPSFGLKVALDYLKKDGIIPLGVDGPGSWLKLNNAVFYGLPLYAGGYVDERDFDNYQILIDYRNPVKNFTQVSLTDVLENRINSNLMTDKLVLIGSTAVSNKDNILTPYSKGTILNNYDTYGVHFHANFASQIISAAKDDRILIQPWDNYLQFPALDNYLPLPIHELVEIISIIFCTAIPVVWGWSQRKEKEGLKLYLLVIPGLSLLTTAFIVGGSYLAFLRGFWIPVVPPLVGLWTGTIAIIGIIYESQRQEDTAKLKESNEQFKKLNATLEYQVEERTRDLKAEKQQLSRALKQLKETQKELILKEKDAALGTLIAGLAHAMLNPISLADSDFKAGIRISERVDSILAENSLILGEIIEDLFPKDELFFLHLKKSLIDGQQQLSRVTKMIRDALEYASDQKKIELVVVKINSFIEQTWQSIEQESKIKYPKLNLKVEKYYDESIEEIEVLDAQFERALIAIGENACHALNQKKQHAEDSFQPIISLTTKNLEQTIEIKIRDNGQGIPEENLNKIFVPFYSGKPSGEGTGLGLYLAHVVIVNQHKGEIQVNSLKGEYTEFVIILPKKFRQKEGIEAIADF